MNRVNHNFVQIFHTSVQNLDGVSPLKHCMVLDLTKQKQYSATEVAERAFSVII